MNKHLLAAVCFSLTTTTTACTPEQLAQFLGAVFSGSGTSGPDDGETPSSHGFEVTLGAPSGELPAGLAFLDVALYRRAYSAESHAMDEALVYRQEFDVSHLAGRALDGRVSIVSIPDPDGDSATTSERQLYLFVTPLGADHEAIAVRGETLVATHGPLAETFEAALDVATGCGDLARQDTRETRGGEERFVQTSTTYAECPVRVSIRDESRGLRERLARNPLHTVPRTRVRAWQELGEAGDYYREFDGPLVLESQLREGVLIGAFDLPGSDPSLGAAAFAEVLEVTGHEEVGDGSMRETLAPIGYFARPEFAFVDGSQFAIRTVVRDAFAADESSTIRVSERGPNDYELESDNLIPCE